MMINQRIPFFRKVDAAQIAIQMAILSLLGVGVLSVAKYNILPATSILEVVFFIASGMLIGLRFERVTLIFAFSAALYVALSYVYAVLFNNVHPLDFLQAYKAFVYISLISIFLDKKVFELERFLRFYKVALLLFAIKYIYSRVFQFSERLAERPGVLDENNFELMFLILPLFALTRFKVSKYEYYFAFVFFLVVISGSRSALLAVMICFLFTFFRELNIKFFACLLMLPVLSYLTYNVFESRMVAGEGIENIDRVKLFYYFLNETEGWSLFSYLFGAERLTPLSDATCLALPFYDDLYSFSGNNSCYSVILHSYLMRVVFDHGLFGLLFVCLFYYRSLRRVGYDCMLALGFLFSIMASALSVSSFNSIYVALSLAVALSLYEEAVRGEE